MITTTAPRGSRIGLLFVLLALFAAGGLVSVGVQPADAIGGERAAILFPYANGGKTWVSGDGPDVHHTFYYGWAEDLHAAEGTAVQARFQSSDGNITLSVVDVQTLACNPSAGKVVFVEVKVDNVYVGRVLYEHLDNVQVTAGQTISVGTTLGYLKLWNQSSCWADTLVDGVVHTHVEVRRGCYRSLSPWTNYSGSTAIGLLSSAYTDTTKTACDESDVTAVMAGGGSTNRRADIISYESNNSFRVGLSTGSSFAWQPAWLSGIAQPLAFGVGDVDADGDADIVSYESAGNSFRVGLSTGSSFTWQPAWVSGVEQPADFGVGDVTGDGKADIVSYTLSNHSFNVGISTGASFTWSPNWLTGIADPVVFGVGYVTNDNKADIVSYEANNSFRVGVSTSSSFTWGAAWLSGVAQPLAFGIGDVDKDGDSDIVSYEALGNAFRVGLSNGSSSFAWQSAWVSGVEQPADFGVGDVDADGDADIVSYTLSNNSFNVGLSTGSSFTWSPNWLTGIANPVVFGVANVNGQ